MFQILVSKSSIIYNDLIAFFFQVMKFCIINQWNKLYIIRGFGFEAGFFPLFCAVTCLFHHFKKNICIYLINPKAKIWSLRQSTWKTKHWSMQDPWSCSMKLNIYLDYLLNLFMDF